MQVHTAPEVLSQELQEVRDSSKKPPNLDHSKRMNVFDFNNYQLGNIIVIMSFTFH